MSGSRELAAAGSSARVRAGGETERRMGRHRKGFRQRTGQRTELSFSMSCEVRRMGRTGAFRTRDPRSLHFQTSAGGTHVPPGSEQHGFGEKRENDPFFRVHGTQGLP